jgi:hypothetical protein
MDGAPEIRGRLAFDLVRWLSQFHKGRILNWAEIGGLLIGFNALAIFGVVNFGEISDIFVPWLARQCFPLTDLCWLLSSERADSPIETSLL